MPTDPSPSNYGDLAFTPAVKAVQEKMGSRDHQARLEGRAHRIHLTTEEHDFIARRDSFYLATAGETGWPYIQHRGGPPGFLRKLGPQELGLADFKGNRQYISTGNIEATGKAHLFLMDYVAQERLKLWVHATVSYDPDLIAQLTPNDYQTRVERAFLFEVLAFDWNCKLHISPRHSAGE